VIAQVPRNAAGRRGLLEALALHANHLDQLATPDHEGGQGLCGRIGERPRRWLHPVPKRGEHVGIDVVGLRRVAERLGKGPHLPRIDDRDR